MAVEVRFGYDEQGQFYTNITGDKDGNVRGVMDAVNQFADELRHRVFDPTPTKTPPNMQTATAGTLGTAQNAGTEGDAQAADDEPGGDVNPDDLPQ